MEFFRYWLGFVMELNGLVMILVGWINVFIVVIGKWKVIEVLVWVGGGVVV